MKQETGSAILTEGQIEEYLETLRYSGCTPSTLATYRRGMVNFYQFLGDGKTIQAGTSAAWQEYLLTSGYAAKTINVYTYAVNGLMRWLGCEAFIINRLWEEEIIQPELTRAEYLRLLSAAKQSNKEKAYLLVKLFGTTGISVKDVKNVTAEAVRAGKIPSPCGNLPIPDGLKEELEDYISGEGIASGPVFLTKSGKPMDRDISKLIRRLSHDARVAEEKANQRCLHRLYLSTRAGMQENLSVLVEQAYDRLLEKEQKVTDWKE